METRFFAKDMLRFTALRWKLVLIITLCMAVVGAVYGAYSATKDVQVQNQTLTYTYQVQSDEIDTVLSGNYETKETELNRIYTRNTLILQLISNKESAFEQLNIPPVESAGITLATAHLGAGLYSATATSNSNYDVHLLMDTYIQAMSQKLAQNESTARLMIIDKLESMPPVVFTNPIAHIFKQAIFLGSAGVILSIVALLLIFLLGDYTTVDSAFERYSFAVLGFKRRGGSSPYNRRFAFALASTIREIQNPKQILLLPLHKRIDCKTLVEKYSTLANINVTIEQLNDFYTATNESAGLDQTHINVFNQKAQECDLLALYLSFGMRYCAPEAAARLGAQIVLIGKESYTRHQQIVDALASIKATGLEVAGCILES